MRTPSLTCICASSCSSIGIIMHAIHVAIPHFSYTISEVLEGLVAARVPPAPRIAIVNLAIGSRVALVRGLAPNSTAHQCSRTAFPFFQDGKRAGRAEWAFTAVRRDFTSQGIPGSSTVPQVFQSDGRARKPSSAKRSRGFQRRDGIGCTAFHSGERG